MLLKINLRQITIFFSYYVFSLYSRSGFSAVNNGIVVNTLVVNHNVVTYKNIDAAFLNHAVFFLHFKPNFFTFLQKKNIIASAEILEGGKFFNWTAWKYFSEQK